LRPHLLPTLSVEDGAPLLFHHASWQGANRIGNNLKHPHLNALEVQG
jgi:hypothetical protein